MSATIYEIAKQSGLSVGTVDRVLNNRGKVSKEAEIKIRTAIKNLNYCPNMAARSLALKRKALKIGIVFHIQNNYFVEVVAQGLKAAENELKDYGITIYIKYSKNFDPLSQLNLINDLLEEEVNAIAITPINDELVIDKLDELITANFPIFCFINDIKTKRPHTFIGIDAYKMGAVTAGFFNLLLCEQQSLFIITPRLKMLGHTERIQGFKDTIRKKNNYINIAGICEIPQTDDEIYKTVKEYFESHSCFNGLWYATSMSDGGIAALRELGYLHKVKIVCADLQNFTIKGLHEGYIAATVHQKPFLQGYTTLKTIFNFFLTSKIDNESCQLNCEIIINENIPLIKQ